MGYKWVGGGVKVELIPVCRPVGEEIFFLMSSVFLKKKVCNPATIH